MNTGRFAVPLGDYGGVHTVEFSWNGFLPSDPGEFPEESRFFASFINSITFTSVPEPSALLLLAVGLLWLRRLTRP